MTDLHIFIFFVLIAVFCGIIKIFMAMRARKKARKSMLEHMNKIYKNRDKAEVTTETDSYFYQYDAIEKEWKEVEKKEL